MKRKKYQYGMRVEANYPLPHLVLPHSSSILLVDYGFVKTRYLTREEIILLDLLPMVFATLALIGILKSLRPKECEIESENGLEITT